MLAILPSTAGAADPLSWQADAHGAYERWLVETSGGDAGGHLDAVNRLFNRLAHRTDSDQWGDGDYWATPRELLARGAGDCEDLAIGKYFALRRLGVADAELAITYVIDLRVRAPHMVLLYRPADGSQALVLDSLHPRVVPLGARPELVPVYALNATGVHVPGRGEQGFGLARSQKHRKWTRLLARYDRQVR